MWGRNRQSSYEDNSSIFAFFIPILIPAIILFWFFPHSVHFNFINLKPEKNSCKRWYAGHRNTWIFRSRFRVFLCSQFQAPLSPKNKRNQLLLSQRKQQAKAEPLLVRKPKQTLPHEPGVHIYVEWKRTLPCPFYRCKLHCFSLSKHYEKQILNPQIQVNIIYWPSLH